MAVKDKTTPPQDKTKRSLRPEFISWSERKDPLRGKLISQTWQDLKSGAVPKYTLETADGRVSFLGTIQIVEAFAQLKMGAEVEVIKQGTARTGQGFNVIQFEINVYEDEPGEADKPVATHVMMSSEGEEIFTEEVGV